MFEKDYLMRQLMQLLEVLQKILIHRKRGEKEQALEQADYFYRILELEGDPLSFSLADMMRWMVDEKKMTNSQLELAAFVMKEQGEMEEEESRRRNYFVRACFILEKVEQESIIFSMERVMKLGEMKGYLSEKEDEHTAHGDKGSGHFFPGDPFVEEDHGGRDDKDRDDGHDGGSDAGAGMLDRQE